MHYLAGRRGAGILTCRDQTVARVDYEFDGFLTKPGQVTRCGEVRMPPEVLRQVFGRKDVQLLTDDGRHFSFRISEKRLHPTSDAAHLDVAGELLPVSEWRH
ncbi:MAG: hypothetical protein OEM93_22150 [Rhodospirillales bacterium]|nr:hypothetical protein [Rhodospirillales bacterium]MDH3790760.1 hypothetical protein [Rhodospirillales bacterium]MDH3918514.1 hypothetical protein [Rhodospirillales bacterium]MDH3967840.1 hypothetical protein [Rhodospirillales bacterium]